jgi:hypothetical protein
MFSTRCLCLSQGPYHGTKATLQSLALKTQIEVKSVANGSSLAVLEEGDKHELEETVSGWSSDEAVAEYAGNYAPSALFTFPSEYCLTYKSRVTTTMPQQLYMTRISPRLLGYYKRDKGILSHSASLGP